MRAEATILTTSTEPDAAGVVVDGGDGGIGAVSLCLGGEPEDEHGAQAGCRRRPRGEGPTGEPLRRRRHGPLADRSGHVVADQHPQEEVGAGHQRF